MRVESILENKYLSPVWLWRGFPKMVMRWGNPGKVGLFDTLKLATGIKPGGETFNVVSDYHQSLFFAQFVTQIRPQNRQISCQASPPSCPDSRHQFACPIANQQLDRFATAATRNNNDLAPTQNKPHSHQSWELPLELVVFNHSSSCYPSEMDNKISPGALPHHTIQDKTHCLWSPRLHSPG